MADGTRKYDLDDRLLEYSASIVRLVENMTGSKAANHVGGQVLLVQGHVLVEGVTNHIDAHLERLRL